MPDSTNIEMIGLTSVIPGERELRIARDVLTIFNTRRPVNIVFTARDKEKESVPIGVNQGGRFSAFCGPSSVNAPTSVNDVASQFDEVNKCIQW